MARRDVKGAVSRSAGMGGDPFGAIFRRCRGLPPLRTAVVHPVRDNVLEAVEQAAAQGLIEPVLIGPAAKIEHAAREARVALGNWQVIDTEHSHAAAERAAALCKMADRGQITGCTIDGPLAFDNAISAVAAEEKGIVSPVAGEADILLVPDIEAGNMLAKQLTFLGGADAAGIVLGARVPVILTSRADGEAARLLSCAIAVLMADARSRGQIK